LTHSSKMETMEQETLAERLRELAAQRGLKPYGVAKGTGLDPAQVLRLMRGTLTEPTPSTLLKLSEFFGVTVDYLLRGSNEPVSVREIAPVDPLESYPTVKQLTVNLMRLADLDEERLDQIMWMLGPVVEAVVEKEERDHLREYGRKKPE
jgi:transcriptional regulator with XRE-family HTH domain